MFLKIDKDLYKIFLRRRQYQSSEPSTVSSRGSAILLPSAMKRRKMASCAVGKGFPNWRLLRNCLLRMYDTTWCCILIFPGHLSSCPASGDPRTTAATPSPAPGAMWQVRWGPGGAQAVAPLSRSQHVPHLFYGTAAGEGGLVWAFFLAGKKWDSKWAVLSERQSRQKLWPIVYHGIFRSVLE